MSAFGAFAVLFFNYLAVPKVTLAASHSDTIQRIKRVEAADSTSTAIA